MLRARFAKMQIPLVLVCTCIIISTKRASASAIGSPFYPLNAEDLTEGEVKEIEYWDKYYHRPKRSESAWSTGSGAGASDILSHLKSAVVSGLKQKIGQVARGSAGAAAGASAGFSKGSFGGETKSYHPHVHDEYPPHEEHHDHKSIDVWDLKKSVLNTLLQAAKAIKGGVLAIKGQLIKGSGYVVAGSGKLLAAGGDKVTQLGKNVINNAVLVPPKDHHPHSDFGSHPSYVVPSGPPVVYEAPSSSGHSYESHYDSHHIDHNDHHHGSHAGILILRRVPASYDKYHTAHSHVVPAFKPLGPVGPTFSTVVGKFFTASTSLNPSEPTPFTDADFHLYQPQDEHHVEEPRHHHHEDLQPPAPPSTNYGVPFENSYNDHLLEAASSVEEQKVKLTKGEIRDNLEGAPTLAASQVQVSGDAPESVQALKASVDGPTLGPPFNSDYPTGHLQISKLENLPEQSSLSNSLEPPRYSRFKKTVSKTSAELENFLPNNESQQETSNELTSKEKYMRFIENFPYYKSPSPSPTYKTVSSKTYLSEKLRMLKLQQDRKLASRPDVNVIKSVSYEITPHGVKRLT